MQDAWVCHWGPPLWIWCNPPYSQIDKVVIKMLADGARGVVVVPDWKTPWLQVLHKIASKEIWYPAGSEVFELNGRPAGPTKWPIYAFLVCGFVVDARPDGLEGGEQRQQQETDAARRRRRRGKLHSVQ